MCMCKSQYKTSQHFKVLMNGSEPKDVEMWDCGEMAAWEGRISKNTVKLVGAEQEPKEGGNGGGFRVGCVGMQSKVVRGEILRGGSEPPLTANPVSTLLLSKLDFHNEKQLQILKVLQTHSS